MENPFFKWITAIEISYKPRSIQRLSVCRSFYITVEVVVHFEFEQQACYLDIYIIGMKQIIIGNRNNNMCGM